MQVEGGAARARGRLQFLEVPAHGILEAGALGLLEGGAVEANDLALGVGEHDAEVEGVEGLPPLLGRLPEVDLEAALPLLRLRALGDVADGADAHGAAVVGGSERARTSTGSTEPSRTQRPVLVGLLGAALPLRSSRISRSSGGTKSSTDRPDEVGDRAAQDSGRAGRWRRRTRPASVTAMPSKVAAARRRNRSSLSRRASSAGSRSMAAPNTAAAAFRHSTSGLDHCPLVARLPEAQEAPPGAVREDGNGGEGLRFQAGGEGLLRLRESPRRW